VGRVLLLDEAPAGSGGPPRGASFGAVTNVGRRPTFGPDETARVESHLLDFRGDLYGRRIEVSFDARLRDERRFPGPEALREQIRGDVERAKIWLEGS
jgi:riboflavin kinase/FMN adenylyltransferase